MPTPKRQWNTPTVRSYGAFETATKDGCNKTWGTTDGLLLEGIAIACTAS